MSDENVAAVDIMPVEKILRQAGRVTPGDLIPLLQKIQEAYGYLPIEALKKVNEHTGIPTSRMYGVITFYAQFSLKPRGRHTIRCCRGTACHVRGSQRIIQTIQNILGLAEGETGKDRMFSFETVACLGACALAPVVVVDGSYHGAVTPQRVEGIINQIVATESGRKEAD